MNRNYTLLTAVFLLVAVSLFSQNEMTRAIQSKLIETTKLTQTDVSEISVTRDFVSSRNGIRHIYGKQLLNGLPVVNSNYGATISIDGELVQVHHHFFSGIKNRNLSSEPSMDALSVLTGVVTSHIPGVEIIELSEAEFLISDNLSYAHTTKAKLGYFVNPEQELFLVWVFNIDMPTKDHWWNFFVDANSGEVVTKHDWQVTCHAGEGHHHNASCVESIQTEMVSAPMMPPPTTDGSSYRVFEFPIESPNHGERTLAVEPASEIASPFGWHDEDGEDGPEFAVTRGNNVHAYEDTDGENGNNPGNAVFGGGTLTFDFPFMAEEGPNSYQDAAVTNLFYANNRIHDILYIYGFDEAAGNFQETNYSGQGFGADPVNAEAQDGGGTNNANMATPEDGFNPRMQMYLWNEPVSFGIFVVNSPAPYAGDYLSSPAADFGAAIPEGGITADLALGFDDSGLDVNDLCEGAVNGNDLTDRIVLLRRGNCSFVQKAENAEAAGAAACIVINNEPGGVINMGGTGNLSIPAIMITLEDGNALIEALNNGETINASLNSIDGGGSSIRDGSFDNGIVVHEYVHGLTNRLVGGADEVGCLQNEEQMGEGWSDWYATMLTMDMTVNNPVYRPMGTFASGEPTNGNGIRPAPYDTSFAVNPYTYANVPDGNITVPHGVGFIWSTMLWDLTWALIDENGFEDLETGTTGGNIVAMNLVTEALFETACNPGFVDGRDAILLADELLYDGAHQCLIWKVFARRGLGFSANQGSSFSRTDGTAAFDLPTFCQEALVAPSADFEVDASNTCTGLVSFTDLSSDIPQSWLWDFGDGSTSDEQNPVHQYTQPGTYTVSLTVTNNVGEDVLIQEDLIVYEALEAPMAEDIEGCEGETVLFTATSGSGDVAWLDENDNVLQYGGDYELLLGANNESVYVQSIELAGPENVGPIDNDFGSGGNHSTEFIGTVVFETHGPATLVSAFINSGGTGVRVINLYEGATTDNEPIATYPILVDFTGGDRIDLDIEIPQPGIYSIGLNNANMYRNDGGVSYPYESEDGLLDIIGSSAGEQYYYYFYDIEVVGGFCGSDAIEVHATVLPNAAFEFETNALTATFNDVSGSTSGWTWDFGDGNTSNEQNTTHTFAQEGTYTVSFTTDQGCTVTAEVEVIATNIEEASTAGILISPNPVKSELRISNLNVDQRIESIKVIDMQGRLIRAISVSSVESMTVDLSQVANGFYLLLIQNQNAETLYQQKLSVVD